MLCRLAFFTGSFTLEAAEAIAGDADFDVLTLVEALCDKSLIGVESEGSAGVPVRFRLAESIRMHASEKISDPSERERLLQRTFEWCLALAEEAFGGWATLPSDRWQALYEPEVENLRGILSLALEQRKAIDLGQRLVALSRRLWGRLAPSEGSHWIAVARRFTTSETHENVLAGLSLAAAHIHIALGQHVAALGAAREALAAYRSLTDDVATGEAAAFVGFTLAELERTAEAQPYLLEALDVFEKRGERQLRAHTLFDLAILHTQDGDYARARTYFTAALAGFRSTENRRGIHAVTVNLAEIEYRVGDAASAVRTLALALAAERDTREASAWLGNMAAYQIALELWDEAAATARECLMLARRFGVEQVEVRALQHLAAIAALRDDRSADSAERSAVRSCAARVLGYVDARLAAMTETRDYSEQIEYERVVDALRAALGEREYDAAYREGATLDLRAAIELLRE